MGVTSAATSSDISGLHHSLRVREAAGFFYCIILSLRSKIERRPFTYGGKNVATIVAVHIHFCPKRLFALKATTGDVVSFHSNGMLSTNSLASCSLSNS